MDKKAFDSFLGGPGGGDSAGGTAAPAYEGDFKLAGGDDEMEEGEDPMLAEVQGLLGTATPEQLSQIKDILSPAPQAPGAGKDPMGGGMPPMVM